MMSVHIFESILFFYSLSDNSGCPGSDKFNTVHIFEFFYSASKSPHNLGNLFSAEQYKYRQKYDNPFVAAHESKKDR